MGNPRGRPSPLVLPQRRGRALGPGAGRWGLAQVSLVAVRRLCRRWGLALGPCDGASTSDLPQLLARGRGGSPHRPAASSRHPALRGSPRAEERAIWRCLCPEPPGTVGPGSTPRLAGVVEPVVFIRTFLPGLSLRLRLGSGGELLLLWAASGVSRGEAAQRGSFGRARILWRAVEKEGGSERVEMCGNCSCFGCPVTSCQRTKMGTLACVTRGEKAQL